MVKPEYLTGECKTFLEYHNDWYSRITITSYSINMNDVGLFYSQPFTEDMIVKPLHYGLEPSPFDNWKPLFKGEWGIQDKDEYFDYYQILTNYRPITFKLAKDSNTDDFIREAIKAGIKLEWLNI